MQPWKLYSMVSGLLFVDFVIMLAWQVLDPLQRRIELFPLEAPVSSLDDAQIRPELEHCESHNNNVWLSLIYAYKGLVLVNRDKTSPVPDVFISFCRFSVCSLPTRRDR